jgi:peptide/nickel transport system substrate-binding protein
VLIVEEPVSAAAITKLGLNELDIYAFAVTDADLYATVLADPEITSVNSFGSYNEFTCNPVPYFTDGRLNPFGFPKIREALNYLVDRDYIADEICGGLASPKYTTLNGAFPDAKARYPHLIAPIVAKYAYNPATAEAIITAEMEALGAYIDAGTGTWFHDGSEIEVSLLIRVEDERLAMGDYLGAQLEDLNFKVIYDYKTSAEAAPLWIFGDPADGDYSIYTGGWVSTAVNRDAGDNFAFFYTAMGLPYPLWMACLLRPCRCRWRTPPASGSPTTPGSRPSGRMWGWQQTLPAASTAPGCGPRPLTSRMPAASRSWAGT